MLTSNEIAFTEYVVGVDVSREQVLAKFPDAKTVPIIIVNGHRVAGSEELQLLLERNQLGTLMSLNEG